MRYFYNPDLNLRVAPYDARFDHARNAWHHGNVTECPA